MAESIAVWLDEKDQIVVQRICGSMTLEDFELVVGLMDECVAKLKDPDSILLLVDGREMAKSPLKVRRTSLQIFREHSMKKMAIFGGERINRITHMFLSAVLGKDRMRSFDTEAEARAWLLT
jgi:hypothetical protein